jgi:hypothetical protein
MNALNHNRYVIPVKRYSFKKHRWDNVLWITNLPLGPSNYQYIFQIANPSIVNHYLNHQIFRLFRSPLPQAHHPAQPLWKCFTRTVWLFKRV